MRKSANPNSYRAGLPSESLWVMSFWYQEIRPEVSLIESARAVNRAIFCP
jgi:hypothetical protein